MELLIDKINIILLITIILNFILGLIIYFNGRNKRINKIYVWNIFHIISWIVAMILFRSATAENNLFWCIILYITPTFIASSFLCFTYIFPSQIKKNLRCKMLVIFFINLFLVILIAIPGVIIKEVNIRPAMEKEIIFGSLYFLYFFYISCYFSYGFIRLFRKYLHSVKKERIQIIYLSFGYALSTNLAFATNLIMPWIGYFFLNWLGQIFTGFMVAFTAYAIVAHRLMDIKFVLRRSSVFLASLSTIFILAISAQYISITFFPNSVTWINVLILITAVSIFIPIKNYYYHFANKYFFTSLYDGRKVIADLSDKLRSTLKAEKIYKYISETFIDSFHAKAVGILIQNKQANPDKKSEDQYILQYHKGFNIGKSKVFPGNKKLCHLFMRHNKSIITEELKHSSYAKHSGIKKTIDLLTKFGVEIVTPLNVKNETVGLIILGQKESGDMYNNEDLSVLKIIGAQAAIAIENALLYEETKNFAIKLKKEVQRATEDFKKANKQLRKLDAAKSDFISIASHQLRTPLTVIKGYISMMIEGNFGKLTKEELESLKKVYESNERLIRLVEDLLNISRIESDKLQFDFQETRLEEVVGSVVEELAGSAERKGLSLAYKKSDQPLPMIKIDGEKIRYVVLNLIDNAIKYTKQGSIAVSLKLGMKHIYFCVIDTGIGISEEDLPNLFKKFSRGKNISIVHPEGTGIGLYVGRMMIKAHQGKIWVESKGKGKGSKFCFKLPISHNS